MVWRTGNVAIAAALGRVDVGDRCGGVTLARELRNGADGNLPRSALRISLFEAILS